MIEELNDSEVEKVAYNNKYEHSCHDLKVDLLTSLHSVGLPITYLSLEELEKLVKVTKFMIK